jgi:hypothetical protein
MYIYDIIQSSVVRHLGYFHSLAIVYSAAIIMGVQMALLYPGLHFFGYNQECYHWITV